jgi:hypothetical protein
MEGERVQQGRMPAKQGRVPLVDATLELMHRQCSAVQVPTYRSRALICTKPWLLAELTDSLFLDHLRLARASRSCGTDRGADDIDGCGSC